MSILFHSKDLEECKYVWKGLELEEHGYLEPNGIDKYISEINEALTFDKLNPEIDNKNYLLKLQLSYIAKKIPIPDDLNWLEIKDDRLCFWIWKTIQKININFDEISRSEIVNSDSRSSSNYFDKPFSYQNLGLPFDVYTTAQRYTYILRFFHLWNCNLNEKEEVIIHLQKGWQETLSIESFNWITNADGNKIHNIDWFFNYMANKLPNINNWDSALPKGMNLNENLINAIGYFDTWPANHPAEKKLFIQSMKKAWAQKKHRDKMQGKKAYSMVMSTDIKGKLDEMAIKNELHRNELLEHIINNSYSDFLEGKLKILKW